MCGETQGVEEQRASQAGTAAGCPAVHAGRPGATAMLPGNHSPPTVGRREPAGEFPLVRGCNSLDDSVADTNKLFNPREGFAGLALAFLYP